MRTSNFHLYTLKETPSDAQIISHQLMLRAGLIRKVASGLYSYMPIAFRIIRKIENIIREEMTNINAFEMLMPIVQPAELWQETNRWDEYGPMLLRAHDRHKREFCFGPTHEEIITDLFRKEINSYKQLPTTLFQIQTKFRDEIRPRFGVMRAREFIMKDAYSLNMDKESLQQSYDDMYKAYTNIFTRLGLDFRAVLADSGAIGGNTSHEFQVLAQSGEDELAVSSDSDYAANVERANALIPTIKKEDLQERSEVTTPNITSVGGQAKHLNVSENKILKTLLVKGTQSKAVALIINGSDSLNEIKAEKLPEVAQPLQMIDVSEVHKIAGCEPGFVGPIGIDVPLLVDEHAYTMQNFICGANKTDYHFANVNWQRDVKEVKLVDIRNVKENDLSPDGKGKLKIIRGIEVGHIFQLGDKYTKAMNATVLNQEGKSQIPLMGCYGIGVSRIMGAAIEQSHDDNGIIWPKAMAPFLTAIIPINFHKSEKVKTACLNLYEQLKDNNIEVLLDDRNERPGTMFADMDLIGIPWQIIIGEKGLAANSIEVKNRKTNSKENISLDKVLDFILTNGV